MLGFEKNDYVIDYYMKLILQCRLCPVCVGCLKRLTGKRLREVSGPINTLRLLEDLPAERPVDLLPEHQRRVKTEHRYPGMPYVVLPGNVGRWDALIEIAARRA